MSELALLSECVKNQTEASDGNIRFIYVDDETVYRFENNKMKKVSKSLIKKSIAPTPQKTNKVVKKKIVVEPVAENEILNYAKEEEEENADEIEIQPPPKPKKLKKNILQQQQKLQPQPANDPHLAEFYENKFKMEYMNKEIEHLTNKVNKLKQYKQIVNKLSGNEWGETTSAPSPPQPASSRNDSLFMF